jgi:DNA polymerase-1
MSVVRAHRELEKCSGCPFGGPKVGSRCNPSAPLAFVLESPGLKEMARGIPVCGPAGKVFFSGFPKDEYEIELDKPLNAGFNTDEALGPFAKEVYINNAMQCVPRGKKKDQSRMQKAAQCCNKRLMQQIEQAPRRVIATMGNAATWSVTGDYNLKITQVRGMLRPHPSASVGVLPMIHPAALLRGTGNYRQFLEDMRYAFHLARGGAPKQPVIPEYVICDTPGKVERAIDDLMDAEYIAADTETAGFNRRKDRILCTGLSRDPKKVYVIPGIHRDYKIDLTLRLGRLFKRSKAKFIWHNGKFDVGFYRTKGIPARCDEDTMLLSYALDETGGIHDLETIGNDLLGAPDYKHVIKPYLRPEHDNSYADVPASVLHKYLSLDVSLMLQIFHILRKQVREDSKLEKLYTRMLIPASEFLGNVEAAGIFVDRERVIALGDEYVGDFKHYLATVKYKRNGVQIAKWGQITGGEIAKHKKIVQDIAGDDTLNPNSPDQVADLLFNKLGLKKVDGNSTAKEVLEKLPQIPVVVALRAFRTVAKSFSTYVRGVWFAIDDDGRVHCTYKIHGTRTGRLSSAKPNMQNIPRDAKLRGMFIAPKGRRFIAIDLNQAELRSLAALSGDPALCAIYLDPKSKSIHDKVAIKLFGDYILIEGDEETIKAAKALNLERKMKAKNCNFGIIYGITAGGLSEQSKVSRAEAQRWIDDWFDEFPLAKKFIDMCRSAPAQGATIWTCFGRKKRHQVVAQERLHNLQNEASNFPHQSIASDITLYSGMKMSGIDGLTKRNTWALQNFLKRHNAFVVNMIHDEVLIEAPDNDDICDKIILEGCRVMEQAPITWGIKRIPFKAEAKMGYRWGSLSDYHPGKNTGDSKKAA